MSQSKSTNTGQLKPTEKKENKLVTPTPDKNKRKMQFCSFCTIPAPKPHLLPFNRRKLPVEKNITTTYFQAPSSCFITVREIEETINPPMVEKQKEELVLKKKRLNKRHSMSPSEIERECELFRRIKIELQDEVQKHTPIQEQTPKQSDLNLKTVGPHWYQELSHKQMMYMSALETSLIADMEEGILSRLQQVLAGLGILPRPTNYQIKKAAQKSFLNPILFLAYLYKYYTTKEEPIIGQKRIHYSVNERLILSGLAFLALPRTLNDLERRISCPIAPLQIPKYPEVSKRYKPKEFGVSSPYLDPQPVVNHLWRLDQEKAVNEKIIYDEATRHNTSVHASMRGIKAKSKSPMILPKAPAAESFHDDGGRRTEADSIELMAVGTQPVTPQQRAQVLEDILNLAAENELAQTTDSQGVKIPSELALKENSSKTPSSVLKTMLSSEKVKLLPTSSPTANAEVKTPSFATHSEEKIVSTHSFHREHQQLSAEVKLESTSDSGPYSELDTLEQVFTLAFNSMADPNPKPKVENRVEEKITIVLEIEEKEIESSVSAVHDFPPKISPSTELPHPIPTDAALAAAQAGYWEGKRFFWPSKEPAEKNPNILKAALAAMGRQGNILAALPHADKVPAIKLWYKYRDGHSLTKSAKDKLMMESLTEWEQHLALPRLVKAPNIPISRNLNWFHKEWVMKYLKKAKSDFVSKVKQASVHDTREYWPPMFMYDFQAPSFKNVYFAYLPSREEDLIMFC